jgi:hypothetical protein
LTRSLPAVRVAVSKEISRAMELKVCWGLVIVML